MTRCPVGGSLQPLFTRAQAGAALAWFTNLRFSAVCSNEQQGQHGAAADGHVHAGSALALGDRAALEPEEHSPGVDTRPHGTHVPHGTASPR